MEWQSGQRVIDEEWVAYGSSRGEQMEANWEVALHSSFFRNRWLRQPHRS